MRPEKDNRSTPTAYYADERSGESIHESDLIEERCRNCKYCEAIPGQVVTTDDVIKGELEIELRGLCRFHPPFVEVSLDKDWCSRFITSQDAIDRAKTKIKELRDTVKV